MWDTGYSGTKCAMYQSLLKVPMKPVLENEMDNNILSLDWKVLKLS